MKTAFCSIRRRCNGQISGRLIAVIAIAVVVALAAIYWLYSEPEEAVPIPAPSTPLETVAPAETKEERGDSARDVIAALREGAEDVDYGEAYRRAVEFQAEGHFADAQLLYFFAARGGHPQAAFDLATLNDPNYFSEETGLMEKPDPFQAYKWYRAARDAGDQTAEGRLAELRTWAESAAADNDANAELLLTQWE